MTSARMLSRVVKKSPSPARSRWRCWPAERSGRASCAPTRRRRLPPRRPVRRPFRHRTQARRTLSRSRTSPTARFASTAVSSSDVCRDRVLVRSTSRPHSARAPTAPPSRLRCRSTCSTATRPSSLRRTRPLPSTAGAHAATPLPTRSSTTSASTIRRRCRRVWTRWSRR